MKLNEGIEWGKDFLLVSHVVWQRLVTFFEGAFEVPFNLVDKSLLKDQSE